MSRNIKEIGKELLGKSLNSFHRKTGLTQLEKNNEMQDGILDGILSQADDAYIEKTDQSNVIHLDGSGDGVVVLDSIEGNTMVNLMGKHTYLSNATYDLDNDSFVINQTSTNKARISFDNALIEPNKTYTVQFNIVKNTLVNSDTSSNRCAKLNLVSYNKGTLMIEVGTVGIVKAVLPQPSNTTHNGKPYFETSTTTTGELIIKDFVALEGDWSDREIPTFKGLQSSFEDKVNDEGKYEIEILLNNANLWDGSYTIGSISTIDGTDTTNGTNRKRSGYIKVKPNTTYMVKQSNYINDADAIFLHQYNDNTNTPSLITWSSGDIYQSVTNMLKFTTSPNTNYIRFRTQDNRELNGSTVTISPINVTNNIPNKQNKIKLLINEPLRGLPSGVKDRLFVIENKLMIERNCSKIVFDGTNNIWQRQPALDNATKERYCTSRIENVKLFETVLCNTLPSAKGGNQEVTNIYIHNTENRFDIQKLKTDNRWTDVNSLNNWFKNNPTVVIYPLAEPYYEEVLNEYGEPILLEGYENGTIYIDSTIVPTTTVRYTPKMQSFKTLKEVNDNNIMLTNDINDNIIPYLMDVDLMIMEKEMALPSQINIRKMEVLDMTSMQKRTQDMLERLIKGKTLTEQECKTRVTTYLNAGKITDAQAEELNFLIDEIYA